MAYGLPSRGQADWDDELNNSIEALRGDVQTALSNSVSAQSNATDARATAQSVRDAVLGAPDAVVAALVEDGESDTAAALSATFAKLRLLDISDYGALCDGTTNDVLAWRAAIADVTTKRAAGKHVDGITWRGTSRIEVNGSGAEAGTAYNGQTTKFAVVIPSDFVVAGQGPHSVIKMTGVPATSYGNPNHNSALGVVDGSKDIVFRDFHVVGENGSYATGFTAVSNNDSAAIDILLSTTTDVTVRNVQFRNLYGFSVHDRGDNSRTRVLDCTVLWCANGINVNANYAKITGNLIRNSEGIECSGHAAQVSGNIVQDALGSSTISLGGATAVGAIRAGVVCTDNVIDGAAGTGISLNDALVNPVVANNTIRKTAKIGISGAASAGGYFYGAIVEGNQVSSCGLSTAGAADRIGIRLTGTGPHLVRGNRVRDDGISGYSMLCAVLIGGAAASASRIQGNDLYGISKDIELDTSTNVKIDPGDYSVISLVNGGTVASVTTKAATTHKEVQTFDHHLVARSTGTNFTVAAATPTAGSIVSVARVNGCDASGRVNLQVGAGTYGPLFTVTFGRVYETGQPVRVGLLGPYASALATAGLYVSARSETSFTVAATSAIAAATYAVEWLVVGG